MQHQDGTFEGHRGTRLFWQSWHPDTHPVGVLILVHGFSEHSGRYAYFVEQLCKANIAVFAFDHRGFGQSSGRPGHIRSMDDYRGDVAAFLALAEAKSPGLPKFLFGHSMGSLVVLDYALRNPEGLRGVITSGVGLEPGGVATPLVIFMARTLGIIWPTFPLKLKIDAADLTRDPIEIDSYDNDPLVHKVGSVRWGNELLNAIAWIKQHAGDLSLPVLMLHGEADTINLPSGSQDFISRVTSADSSFYLYPGGLHELHHDLDKENVLADLTKWILQRA